MSLFAKIRKTERNLIGIKQNLFGGTESSKYILDMYIKV
jgi:hypothetical protein